MIDLALEGVAALCRTQIETLRAASVDPARLMLG